MPASSFFPWPSIGKLSDVRSPADGTRVYYRPKVKLHGTHAAIRIDSVKNGGTVTAQSRTKDLQPGKDTDNFGFAAWLSEYADECLTPWHDDRILYGEWYGPGVQKNIALSETGRKKFAVYAARYASLLVFSPNELRLLCDTLPCHVLPWYGPGFEFDFARPDAASLERINKEVEDIDAQCPWAYEMHGIVGVGEGLVMFPHPQTVAHAMDLAWKAKGASHRTSGKVAVTARAVASADVQSFIDSVLTEARLMQGVQEGCGGYFSKLLTSSFLKWIGNDVLRECVNELTASGLDWKDVAKTLSSRAARWYTRVS